MIGQIDSKYELLRLIDEGGAGAVYAARDADGADCAVKVFGDAVPEGDGRVAQHEGAIAAARALSSPHLVAIRAGGRDAGTGKLFTVMELLAGEGAQALQDRLGPLAPELVLSIGAQACEGLAEAHRHGLVHGALRPAQLFLAEGKEGERVVKVLGFTEAAGIERSDASVLRYRAPEHPAKGASTDRRADVWALGVVLHHLLTARAFERNQGEPPPLVSDDAPWVPGRLAAAVAGAMRTSVDERYQGVEQLRDALRGCLQGDGRITTTMLVALSDEQRKPAPLKTAPMRAVAPSEPAAAAAPPQGEPAPVPAVVAAPEKVSGTAKTAAMPAVDPAQAARAAASKTVALPAMDEMEDELSWDAPPAPPPAKPATPFIPLDSTIAISNPDIEPPPAPAPAPEPAPEKPFADKPFAEKPAAEKPAAPKAPANKPAAAEPNLGATLAFDAFVPAPAPGAGAAPSEERAAPLGGKRVDGKPASTRPLTKPAAAVKAEPAPQAAPVDAAVLERHRAAQRAAINAARLEPMKEESGGSSKLVLIIAAAGAAAGVLVLLLYFLLRSDGVETTAPAAGPSAAPPEPATAEEPEPTEPDSSPPAAPSAEPSGEPTEPSASPSASQAAPPGSYRVKVNPPYAHVTLDGMPVRLQDGMLDIPGKVGETHVVIVKVPGRPPQLVKVALTETGPVPATIEGPPARVPGRR